MKGISLQQEIVILRIKKSTYDIDIDPKTKLLCTCHHYFYMQLMMFLGNDLIESVQLEHERISKPGYLGSFKRSLKEKYSELIQQSPVKPEFLVVDPIAELNRKVNQN